jgi:hypothetical protein
MLGKEHTAALMAEVEVRIKKSLRRNGKRRDVGEVTIAFGSIDAHNGMLDRLRGNMYQHFDVDEHTKMYEIATRFDSPSWNNPTVSI